MHLGGELFSTICFSLTGGDYTPVLIYAPAQDFLIKGFRVTNNNSRENVNFKGFYFLMETIRKWREHKRPETSDLLHFCCFLGGLGGSGDGCRRVKASF